MEAELADAVTLYLGRDLRSLFLEKEGILPVWMIHPPPPPFRTSSAQAKGPERSGLRPTLSSSGKHHAAFQAARPCDVVLENSICHLPALAASLWDGKG